MSDEYLASMALGTDQSSELLENAGTEEQEVKDDLLGLPIQNLGLADYAEHHVPQEDDPMEDAQPALPPEALAQVQLRPLRANFGGWPMTETSMKKDVRSSPSWGLWAHEILDQNDLSHIRGRNML